MGSTRHCKRGSSSSGDRLEEAVITSKSLEVEPISLSDLSRQDEAHAWCCSPLGQEHGQAVHDPKQKLTFAILLMDIVLHGIRVIYCYTHG